jgi:hypothetical protein
MNLGKRKPSGREKDEAAVKLLDELRERLYSDNPSNRRKAAFNLSWMQEDGLDILKEALFGPRFPRTAKTAAAYGLRSMHGRMKKMAIEVFQEGLKHPSRDTCHICKAALAKIGTGARPPAKPRKRVQSARVDIKEVPARTRRTRRVSNKSRSDRPSARPRRR